MTASGMGENFIDQRRSELNLFLAPDKNIPTLVPHKCKLKQCLLNIGDTYNGSTNGIIMEDDDNIMNYKGNTLINITSSQAPRCAS